MPIQAIDGVVMLGTGEKEEPVGRRSQVGTGAGAAQSAYMRDKSCLQRMHWGRIPGYVPMRQFDCAKVETFSYLVIISAVFSIRRLTGLPFQHRMR